MNYRKEPAMDSASTPTYPTAFSKEVFNMLDDLDQHLYFHLYPKLTYHS